MIDEANTLARDESVVITRPEDMARLLRVSCPEKATDFALAAHERACWAYDEHRTLFWEHVANILTDETEDVQQVAA